MMLYSFLTPWLWIKLLARGPCIYFLLIAITKLLNAPLFCLIYHFNFVEVLNVYECNGDNIIRFKIECFMSWMEHSIFFQRNEHFLSIVWLQNSHYSFHLSSSFSFLRKRTAKKKMFKIVFWHQLLGCFLRFCITPTRACCVPVCSSKEWIGLVKFSQRLSK